MLPREPVMNLQVSLVFSCLTSIQTSKEAFKNLAHNRHAQRRYLKISGLRDFLSSLTESTKAKF